MKSKDIIKGIMKEQSFSQIRMANTLGISVTAMSDRLNCKGKKDLSVSTLTEMATVLGYKVVLMPTTCKTPEGGYVVE